MRIGTNIAFISHQAMWGNFLIMTTHLYNEMSMREIITVEDGTESEASDIHFLL